jgi:hypothetical protein
MRLFLSMLVLALSISSPTFAQITGKGNVSIYFQHEEARYKGELVGALEHIGIPWRIPYFFQGGQVTRSEREPASWALAEVGLQRQITVPSQQIVAWIGGRVGENWDMVSLPSPGLAGKLDVTRGPAEAPIAKGFGVVEYFPDAPDRWYYKAEVTVHSRLGVTMENVYQSLVVGPHFVHGPTLIWLGIGQRTLLVFTFTF